MVGEGKGVKTVITEIFLNNDMKIYAKHIDGTALFHKRFYVVCNFPHPSITNTISNNLITLLEK